MICAVSHLHGQPRLYSHIQMLELETLADPRSSAETELRARETRAEKSVKRGAENRITLHSNADNRITLHSTLTKIPQSKSRDSRANANL